MIILFEICKIPNPNTKKIENLNPDLNLWVFCVCICLVQSQFKTISKTFSIPFVKGLSKGELNFIGVQDSKVIRP